MAHNSSSSSLSFTSSSSTSASSAHSSPYSSPTSLPLPLPLPPPPYVCKLSVPFLWEEKPGINKPLIPSSSHSLNPCITIPQNIFYHGTSLDLPPLPPPPCLSHAALLSSSQPRSREIKLLHASHSLLSRSPHEAKPSKELQEDDPFFLAFKACTDDAGKRDVSKEAKLGSFDGLPAALSVFKPTKKSGECKRRNDKKNSDHHQQIRREVSFNHQYKATQELISFNGQDNHGRGKVVATSSHGDLLSMEVRASRGSNLYTHMLESKDEASTHKRAAHHHMNAGGKAPSSKKDGGVANGGKKDDPMQGVHVKASARGQHSKGGSAEEGGHGKSNVRGSKVIVIEDGHKKQKQIKDGKVKAYSGDYTKTSGNDVYKYHHPSKLYTVMSDMLGCKSLPPVNGAAIHPSLNYFHDKLFSPPH